MVIVVRKFFVFCLRFPSVSTATIKCSSKESKMIMRNVTSVLPTKNTRSKIVSKISNSRELNVPYLAALGCAVIIIGHPTVKF